VRRSHAPHRQQCLSPRERWRNRTSSTSTLILELVSLAALQKSFSDRLATLSPHDEQRCRELHAAGITPVPVPETIDAEAVKAAADAGDFAVLPENALRGTVLPRHQDVFTSVGGIVTPAAGGIALVLVLVALNRIKTNEQFKAVGGGLKTQREILAMADTPGARVSTRRTQGVSDLERLRMVVRRVGYDFFQAKASKPYERRAEPFAMANQQALQFHSRRLLFGLLYEQGVDAATALRHSAGGGYITTDGMRCLEVDDAIHMPLGGSSRRSILMDTFTRACMAKTDVIAALHDNQSNVFDAAAWADSGSVAADTALVSLKEVAQKLWASADPAKYEETKRKKQANTTAQMLVSLEKRRRLANHPQ
jgi:hypothetical protein